MKYPGPTRLDYGLAPPRPKPLVPDPENPPGPTVVPGTYGVELTVGEKGKSKSHAAKFTVVRDPRLPTTAAEYAAQFALHKELIASVSKLKQAVNRLRKMKRQLEEATGHLGRGERALKNRAEGIVRKLSAIESVMVDPHRKSVRDVLRNPAGLNDTLIDMVAMATTADAAADHPDEGGVARGHGQGRQRGRQVRGAGEGRHRPAQRGARQGPREARDGGVGRLSGPRRLPRAHEHERAWTRAVRKSMTFLGVDAARWHAQAPVRKNGRTRHGR